MIAAPYGSPHRARADVGPRPRADRAQVPRRPQQRRARQGARGQRVERRHDAAPHRPEAEEGQSMRQSDGLPPDPDVLAELEAIDATLAGLAIDPAYAELAELALLLADERPRIAPAVRSRARRESAAALRAERRGARRRRTAPPRQLAAARAGIHRRPRCRPGGDRRRGRDRAGQRRADQRHRTQAAGRELRRRHAVADASRASPVRLVRDQRHGHRLGDGRGSPRRAAARRPRPRRIRHRTLPSRAPLPRRPPRRRPRLP